jgi:hypothetical protein
LTGADVIDCERFDENTKSGCISLQELWAIPLKYSSLNLGKKVVTQKISILKAYKWLG